MKKLFLPVNAAAVFLCGLLLAVSYEASGHSAWSLLVSSVRPSPWETVKPYGLVFIFWSFIELSLLRPHLLRFVSARIFALHLFVLGSNMTLCITGTEERSAAITVFVWLVLSEVFQTVLYRSGRRTEIFFIPLIISFVTLFFALLFCTFFPPDMVFFRT